MSDRNGRAKGDGGARRPGDRGEPEGAAGGRGEDRPLADRRSGGQGSRPSPDEEIAAEREPSPTDPAAYDRSEEGDEPPEYPTRA